jgi:MFS family permease
MKVMLDNLFPLRHIRNVSMFYVLTCVYNLWFVAAVWVFIWGVFMTKTEIGLSDAITFTLGFMVELPSGVFADVIGRRRAILLGNTFLTIGNLGVALSSSFISLTSWYLLWTVGYAFQSGATEALTYDSVKKAGKEDEWQKIIGTATILSRISSMSATVIGGLLFSVWFRLPYLIFAISGIVGIIAAYKLIEIPVKRIESPWSIRSYISQIKDGLRVLTKPSITPIAILALCVAGLSYIYNWGLLRPLTGERFGYTAITLPFLLVGVSIAIIGASIMLVKLKNKINPENTLVAISLVFGVAFVALSMNLNWISGGIVMVIVAVLAELVMQLFSKFINQHTESRHRATTLSAIALFTKLLPNSPTSCLQSQ